MQHLSGNRSDVRHAATPVMGVHLLFGDGAELPFVLGWGVRDVLSKRGNDVHSGTPFVESVVHVLGDSSDVRVGSSQVWRQD